MSSGFISRSIAETHYQLGVAQAHCEDFVNAEKSLKAAISVLDKRVVNLKKMEVSENNKELAELDTLCYDIKERMNDHKDIRRECTSRTRTLSLFSKVSSCSSV